MNKLKFIIPFFLFLLMPLLGSAQEASSAEPFNQGVEHYLKKDYEKAQGAFTKALDLDPDNATILTNLALVEFQRNKKTLAVGLLRRALNMEPNNYTAQASLKFILNQIQVKDIPHQINAYETLRGKLLQNVSLITYLFLSTLTFFAFGWSLVAYFGRRKKALDEEKALPSFPAMTALFCLSFLAFTGLAGLKIYDSSVVRGTILEEKVSLQTAPGENQVAILDLYGGMEVITREIQGDWIQVTYPGALSGWIKKSSVLMTR